MTSNLDIYRTAAVLIRTNGKQAAQVAEASALALSLKGDYDGAAVMGRVAGAVRELEKREPDGEAH